MHKLALVSNVDVFNEFLPAKLNSSVEVTQFNVFGLLNDALKEGQQFDIILYIVPYDFEEDKYFHAYLNENKRTPIFMLGNDEGGRLKLYQDKFGIEGYMLIAEKMVSIEANLKLIIQNKVKRKKVNPKTRFGLTTKEVVLLRLLSSKNGKDDVCKMMNLSARQIERIKKSAFEKIGAKSDFQAGVWFNRHYLSK